MARADDLENIAYIVYWSAELDEKRNLIGIEHYRPVNMEMAGKNEWPIFVDFEPGKAYRNKAKGEFRVWR